MRPDVRAPCRRVAGVTGRMARAGRRCSLLVAVGVGIGAGAFPGRARAVEAAPRCTGSWLVTAGPCFASAARADCGMVSPREAEAYVLQDTWPWVVDGFVAAHMTCQELFVRGAERADEEVQARRRCAEETQALVEQNLWFAAHSVCGRPMFLAPYCRPGPQPDTITYALVFQVEVLTHVNRLVTQINPFSIRIGRGERVVVREEYASCQHPSNGERPVIECLAQGDGLLTGPGLTASEALATITGPPTRVAAVCLTQDAPAVGVDRDGEEGWRRQPAALLALDHGNLAR